MHAITSYEVAQDDDHKLYENLLFFIELLDEHATWLEEGGKEHTLYCKST